MPKVKLENIAMGQKNFHIFIRGGSTVNINILLGQYRLKYAMGTTAPLMHNVLSE